MDTETQARRRAGRMLPHRAEQLRKTADEPDAIEVETETGEVAPSGGADQTDQGKTPG